MAKVLTDIKVGSLSVMKAPTCEDCHFSMEGAGDIYWVCRNTGCKKNGEPVYVNGLYPFRIVEESRR